MAADVKKLADTLLGKNSIDSNTEVCQDKAEEINPCCNAQKDISISSNSCQNTKEAIKENVEQGEILEHDPQEASNEITIAMAYEIQSQNPFSALTSHFQSLKNIFSFGKPNEKSEIITTKEIEGTPLPKYLRKPYTRKFRQRHFLTPSLQSRIRRILTTYKFNQFDKYTSIDFDYETEEFHSAQIGDSYQNNASAENDMLSIQESREVNFNVTCSKSMHSFNSSNIEYEIASNIKLLNDECQITDKYEDWEDENEDSDKLLFDCTVSSESHKVMNSFAVLDEFLDLLKQASKLYEEPSIEHETESLFIQMIETSMEHIPSFQNELSSIIKFGRDFIDPKISSSNYEKFKKSLDFLKTLSNNCSELQIPVSFISILNLYITS